MSRAEFGRWVEFYNRQPFDDYNRHHRPAALVAQAASGGRAPMSSLLEWLRQDHSTEPDPVDDASEPVVDEHGYTAADRATMRGLGMRPPPRKKV